jgi:hypothetical protein
MRKMLLMVRETTLEGEMKMKKIMRTEGERMRGSVKL